MSGFVRLLGVALLVFACVFGINTVIALAYGELAWTAILALCTIGLTVAGHTVRNYGRVIAS
jgi:hypothetical protein